MINSILVLLCILTTSSLGFSVLFIACGRNGLKDVTQAEKIGFSYLFGMGAVSLSMFLVGISNIAFTRFNILFPWAILSTGLIIWCVILKKPVPAEQLTKSPALIGIGKLKVKGRDIALILLIVLQSLYNFFRALMKPIEAYDAVAIYGLKAKIMYLAHGITPDFFQNIASNFHGAHPDYPLLVPLSETWVYTFLGQFNDILVKAIFPMFYLSFLFVFYALLKKVTKNQTISILFTFLLASIKQFSDYSIIGMTDMQLGIFFAISVIYLYLWFSAREKTYLYSISLVGTIFCLWTKNEGMLLAMITLAVFFIYIVSNIRKVTRKDIYLFVLYMICIATLLLVWNNFKEGRVPLNENFNLSMVSIQNIKTGFTKIPAILYGYQKEFFGLKKWNILWIIFLGLFGWKIKMAILGKPRYITLAILLFFAGYFSMYMFSVVEIQFFVRFTASRFLLHILPVVVFWIAIMLKEAGLISEHDRTEI